MTLHIVNQSPYSGSALGDCLKAFAAGDALLLIEDGVYGAGAHQPLPEMNIYCLKADAEARGVTVADHIECIDESRWVALCAEHNPIVSWFR